MAKAAGNRRKTDLDRLLDQAPAKEAGVAEALRVYEASEAIYVAASQASSAEPISESATGTNLPARRAR